MTNQLMLADLMDVSADLQPEVRGHAIAMETAPLYHVNRRESLEQFEGVRGSFLLRLLSVG